MYAMGRTAVGGAFRANLLRGSSGRMVILTANEQPQCVQAAKAVVLKFAGVNVFIEEINGNYDTGITNITGYNYFV